MARDERSLRRENQLDTSPESAGRTAIEADHEQNAPDERDGRADNRTGFDPSDVKNEYVERDGERKSKWNWLSRLNQSAFAHDNRDAQRTADRHEDIRILVDNANEFAREQELDFVLDADEVIRLLDRFSEMRENGLEVGSVPVEVPILAALSLHANQEGWMFRQTEIFDEFMERYIPETSDVDRGEVMRSRQSFRETISWL